MVLMTEAFEFHCGLKPTSKSTASFTDILHYAFSQFESWN